MEHSQRDKLVKYWVDGSKNSLRLAGDVFDSRHFDHALFCGHLALEKLFKAKVVKIINNHAPHSHDLLYLAGLSKVDLDIEQQQFLVQVNKFNIEGRYPEEKSEFYHLATKKYAGEWLEKIKKFYLWLSKQNGKN